MHNIFWTGYSGEERHATIQSVTAIVNRHGYVIDFKPFSDLSLALVIEIEESRIDQLYDDLAAHMAMKPFERLASASTRERTVYLNLAFTRGTGDLIHEIPATPG
jgi:hypothetical protein